MGNKISESAAVESLKRLYGDSTSDFISIKDIFSNAGRADRDQEANRNWLYNKLSALNPHLLFEKRFTVRNGTRSLEGLVLTTKGRAALGRNAITVGKPGAVQASRKPTFESVKADVDTLRAEFPALRIVFDVRLNDDARSS
ncbi:MAG TPA: hypothetical protein VFZ48_05300 [Candidatus Saccharimonadales bacterium]